MSDVPRSDSPTSVVTAWASRGSQQMLADHDVFVIDHPADAAENGPPILVLHGFPSCSFDWRHVLDRLSANRRVLLVDFVGFGLSAKPDLRYTMALQADVSEALVASLGIETVTLLTHDMGDTVGGELLARDLDGALPFSIEQRVITNGSIYIEMAHLTPGQELLLSLPDEPLDPALHPGPDAFKQGLGSTFSPEHPASSDELDAQWELVSRNDGHLLLPRTIRYIEERRANQPRFTGAIERHPSPLTIVWGDRDPVAVYPMAERLATARPDATLVTLEGVGHYPMVEAPDRFADAVMAAL